MDYTSLYEEIDRNPESFRRYTQAQALTKEGKRKLAQSVFDAIGPLSKNQVVGILPSDIGLFYETIRQFYPENQFVLIDKSRAVLKHVIQTSPLSRVSVYCGSIMDLSFLMEDIDLAVSVFATHLINDQSKYFTTLSRHLTIGAKVVLVSMTPDQEKIHPLGAFFRNKKSRFVDLQTMTNVATSAGLKLFSSKEIAFVQNLDKADIPIAFSRYANSFLFRQSEADVRRYHELLATKSLNDDVICLSYAWTLFVLVKEKCV